MELIKQSDLLKVTGGSRIPAQSLSAVLMNTLKLNQVNKLYSRNHQKRNLEFLEAVLQDLEIKYEMDESDLNKIPKNGPFITVSNHPLGGVDGLLLLKIISMVRNDYKVFGNFFLQRIEPIEDYLIPVNPFEDRKNLKSSVSGMLQAFRHLNDGHCLGIFPAGEVSAFSDKMIQDKQWSHTVVKFIKNSSVPVVPIYFHGYNSSLFYLLGMIRPILRTAKLPSELFNKKNKTIKIRIGNPISPEVHDTFPDIDQFGRYLRAKTYSLGSALEVRNFFQNKIKASERKEKIIEALDAISIEYEIKSLTTEQLLFTSGKFQVYCAPSNSIPLTLNEIGRLREITFREVGEGSNRSIDLDEFDLYYEHLFIWDDEKKRIAGSYRIGKGKEILRFFGKKGFYINSLFHLRKEMKPVLGNSLELGRSFVVKEYQKQRASLFLLWKGILWVLLRNPQYRYLVGPVSISNNYSALSKSLIIDFIQNNYFHPQYSAYVKPRKKFRVKYKNVDHRIMLEHTGGDLEKLDKMIEEIEPSHYKVPVLFKKYLKQNARIMGFNVDPRFNKALDGLMILDLFEVPVETLKSLSKEMDDVSILERFYSKHATDEYARAPQL